MDKDEPIDGASDSDQDIGNSEDETIIGPPPDLGAEAHSDSDNAVEAIPADDGTPFDFKALDSDEGEPFDIDKTVNFKPLEEADDFEIDKTVNFSPVEEDAPIEDVDLDAVPVSEGEVDAGEAVPVEEPPAEDDLDAEVEASSIELPPDKDQVDSEKPKALPRGTRRRNLPPAKVKRRSAAESYQKTSKPGKTFLVKKILFFFIPLSLISIIALGFVLKNEDGDMVWVGFMKNFGLMDATPKEEGTEDAMARVRPEIADYQTVQSRIAMLTLKIEMIEGEFRKNDTWTKETAMQARGELNTVRQLLESSILIAQRIQAWFDTYEKDVEELRVAHDGGDKDQVEQLNKKLELGKYDYVDEKLGRGNFISSTNRVKSLQRRADLLHGRLPSLEEIADGKLPEGRKKAGDGSHNGGTAVSFNPSIVTPYFFISVGAWKRVEILTEDLALFGEPTGHLEDTILSAKELRKDFIVLKMIRFVNELEFDPIEEKRDVVKSTKEVESITVAGSELSCRILRSNTETRWVLSSGKMANQLPIKLEKEDYLVTAVEMGEESISVGEESLSCVWVKYEGSDKGRKITQTVWYSTKVPLWVVKRETEIKNSSRMTETLLAYGKSSRPAFPVPEKKEEGPDMVEEPSETPSEETPSEETPAEETPSEENPETPSEETPVEEKPTEETPSEETPTEETPSEEKPTEETPETPKETPQPPKKSSEDYLREANLTLKEAIGLFVEVSKAIQKGLPQEKEKLKTVQETADTVEKLFALPSGCCAPMAIYYRSNSPLCVHVRR